MPVLHYSKNANCKQMYRFMEQVHKHRCLLGILCEQDILPSIQHQRHIKHIASVMPVCCIIIQDNPIGHNSSLLADSEKLTFAYHWPKPVWADIFIHPHFVLVLFRLSINIIHKHRHSTLKLWTPMSPLFWDTVFWILCHKGDSCFNFFRTFLDN